MDNEWQMNNNEQGFGLTNGGNGKAHVNWTNNVEEYDLDALLGADDYWNTDQDEDDEGRQLQGEQSSSKRRKKRFSLYQITELESSFEVSAHPDDSTRQALAQKTGLTPMQVKFWFQNRRTKNKGKTFEKENKDMGQENDQLRADNEELRQRVEVLCRKCENAKLKDTILRAKQNLINRILEANVPHHVKQQYLAELEASLNQVPLFTYNGSTNQATIMSYAERALDEFILLEGIEEPMWLKGTNGKTLNHQEYKMIPGLLRPCPPGFVTEATKENSVVRGSASYLAGLLSDVTSWSKMFPGVIAGVRASIIIHSGHLDSCDGLIQEIHVDMWVQSPFTPNRSLKFLRFTKKIECNKWAVVDVSVDGIQGIEPEGSRIGYMSCRLRPSGCLLEDNIISKGISKVTWIVHVEYDETTVPLLFQQLFKSGQALGATRWLASFQRQCENMNILNSCCNGPRGSTPEQAMSGIAKRSILELAQRMTPSFFAAVSRPAALLDPSNNTVQQWIGRCGTAPNMFDVTVRMVMWSCPVMGAQPVPVLSATTTVWLPGTPPLRVLDYLCDGQRRGEWDSFAYGSAVEELTSVKTWRTQRGNVVSVLQPKDDVVRTNNFSNVLLLQEATNDLSCSLVVFSFIAKEMLLAAMDGADNSSIFLMPSGFAILPDGYGNPRLAHRASAVAESSSAPTNYKHITGGSILTAAYQALLPSSMSNHSLDATGNRVCLAINQILAAVGDDMAFPA